jgi:uncharacterized protein (DUF2461 family)
MPPSTAKPTSVAVVPYFKPEALKFLRSLARHNDREWFQPRKALFEANLKEPRLEIMPNITDAALAGRMGCSVGR